jgi:hypothetical protein
VAGRSTRSLEGMANIDDFDTGAALGEFRSIAQKYRVPLDIEAVPDVQQWCLAHGISEDHPFRSGCAVQNSENGRYLVLLANPLTSSMVGSAIGGMMARGFGERAEELREPCKFARHLVLHEVAHVLDSARSEMECDEWAFQEMGRSHAP